MYDSDEGMKEPSASFLGEEVLQCRKPPTGFRVQFTPTEVYDKGKQISFIVDGILCLNETDAQNVFKARLNEVKSQWEDYLKKNT